MNQLVLLKPWEASPTYQPVVTRVACLPDVGPPSLTYQPIGLTMACNHNQLLCSYTQHVPATAFVPLCLSCCCVFFLKKNISRGSPLVTGHYWGTPAKRLCKNGAANGRTRRTRWASRGLHPAPGDLRKGLEDSNRFLSFSQGGEGAKEMA